MVSRDYTVTLEQVFNGPMDLLLHLVREQEVEIHEIDIHRVIESYLKYLKELREVDIELAADFLVMAATLMAIKSRSLLPSETVDLAEELDPRDELIQRLIEYRHFKHASRDLQERFDAHARIHPHGFQAAPEVEASLDISEISHWDLLAAFSRLMRETLANKQMVITSDERPVRYYVEQLIHTIKSQRSLSLREIVEAAAEQGGGAKNVLIGTFCALLELVKLGAVRAHQPTLDGDITISLRDEVAADVDSIVRMTEFDDERPPAEEVELPMEEAESPSEDAADEEEDEPRAVEQGEPLGS